MSAMVFHLMKRIMKFTARNMLWMTRVIESWLETFDEQDIPNLERPMVNGEEREQVEEANDQGRKTQFVQCSSWEEA